jgi:hypothetical protein
VSKVNSPRGEHLAGSNCECSERGDTKKQLLSWLRDEFLGASLETGEHRRREVLSCREARNRKRKCPKVANCCKADGAQAPGGESHRVGGGLYKNLVIERDNVLPLFSG